MSYEVQIGPFKVGSGHRPFLIAGPCVIESEQIVMDTAGSIAEITKSLGMPYIFKSSFDKANRTSIASFRGPGMEKGMAILRKVREQLDLPVLTDVHTEEQATAAGKVVDVLQIPAFLCRQTDLLVAAANTGKVVNVKKGQFLSPAEMGHAVKKVEECGSRRILITERVSSFEYNNLIVDMRAFPILRSYGYPVVFDAGHSIRKYGIPSKDPRGSARQFLTTLARSAVAAGVDGFFIESHPNPPEALCDAASQYALDDLESFMRPLIDIHNLVRSQTVH